MLETIVGALLPVVLTLVLGVIAGWRHDENSKSAGALNRMVLRYALPLALFAGTVGTPRTTLLAQGKLALILLIGTVVPFVIAFGLRYWKSRDLSAAALQGMGFGFPSIPFTAIAILTPLVGNAAVLVVAVGGSVINILVVPATLVALALAKRSQGGSDKSQQQKAGSGDQSSQAGSKNDQKGTQAKDDASSQSLGKVLMGSLLSPIVLAPVIALILVLSGVTVPKLIVGSFKLLGSTVGGVALFASGVILQAQKPTLSWPIAISTIGRNLLIPGIAFGLLTVFGIDHEVRKIAVLAFALPAAALQITLAVQNNVAEKESASFLLYSNVLSVFTLGLFIWLLK